MGGSMMPLSACQPCSLLLLCSPDWGILLDPSSLRPRGLPLALRCSRPGSRTRPGPPVRPSPSSSRRACSALSSVPRPIRRRTSSSQVGGSRKTSGCLGHRLPHRPCPLQIDLEQHTLAVRPGPLRSARVACRTGTRCAPVAHSSICAAGDQPVEFVVADEEVVDAVDLPRPRPSGRRRDREQHLRIVLTDVPGHRALADRGRSGEHDEPGRCPLRRSVLPAAQPVAECPALPDAEARRPASMARWRASASRPRRAPGRGPGCW